MIAATTLRVRHTPMTVAEYLEKIAPTFSPGTAATYAPYWRLAVARFGDRHLGDVGVDDCAAVVAEAAQRARNSRPSSDGRSSRENCVSALRALFTRAQRSGLIGVNPAAAVPKPLRRPSRRRPLDHPEVEELINAIRTTSSDPDLDLLLVRFHLESGARREGALNLRMRDIDEGRATVWLREKFGAERERPISPSLVRLSSAMPTPAAALQLTTRCSDHAKVSPSLDVGTTRSSIGRERACRGPNAPRSPRTCSATPRLALLDASRATR